MLVRETAVNVDIEFKHSEFLFQAMAPGCPSWFKQVFDVS